MATVLSAAAQPVVWVWYVNCGPMYLRAYGPYRAMEECRVSQEEARRQCQENMEEVVRMVPTKKGAVVKREWQVTKWAATNVAFCEAQRVYPCHCEYVGVHATMQVTPPTLPADMVLVPGAPGGPPRVVAVPGPSGQAQVVVPPGP